ncbi:hypothetical protein BDA96_10G251600 [Sorghum bicolor]|uniref:Uncharacterized protein n=1 Tax=Sorghum bicolor TaxID=4558 RepID=A0A921Q519_SORBI|nr:hypothetical protein BDA96_10G251600 [Sorghum bicolor]
MHCSHCSDGGHNKAGCRLKKMGFNSEEAKALVATTQATTQLEAQEEAMRAAADQVNENETPDALNISSTQPPSLVEMTQASSSVLSEMLGEETHESSLSQPQGPLPDPIFIMSNQPVQRPTPLTTSTAAGRAALSKKRSSTSQKTSSKKAKTPTGASSKTGT